MAITVTSKVPIDAATRLAVESEAEELGRFCNRTPVLEIMHRPA